MGMYIFFISKKLSACKDFRRTQTFKIKSTLLWKG